MTTGVVRFTRDVFTWFAYSMLAYFSYMLAAISPIMVFVAAELDMSYTVRGLHLSAFALGMILAGLTADRAARRLTRRVLWWGGGTGMAVGIVLLIAGRAAGVTILGSLIMGLLGSYMLVMIQSTLSDHHGPRRAMALTEANVAASGSAMLAPLLVSQFEALGIGFRVAALVGVAVWVLTVLFMFRTPIPEVHKPTAETPRPAGRLPRIFWTYWWVVVLVVAVEWCTLFWGAEFLERVVGFTRVDAASAMTVFLFAMLFGRFLGTVLTRAIAPSRLLTLAAGLVVAGFPIFYLSRSPAPAFIALFMLGLGIANLFPLTLAQTTTVGAVNSDRASARTSLASGMAILVTPQVLGSLADQIGIQGSFLIVGGLALGAFALVLWCDFSTRRLTQAQPA